ncbi:restriction endonuclease subunit S [Salinirubellus salinus]|uniref:Restriction endonuclease subunit S n=1 Tax=Salinirubellus salinus TaxID=1364945 RepID=A0A9E7UAT3_9EURY|nr:restriction endonuclease subunit S [Salinirubellus salinus]UWM54124.1 restriction endonuclease subunit S [Salinirubellus salinus]
MTPSRKFGETGARDVTEVRLNYVTEINPSKSEVSSLPDETEVSFIPMEDFGRRNSINGSTTRPIKEVYDGYTYFAEGDVVIAKITPCFENQKGAICRNLTNGIGFGTTELYVLRPSSDLEPRYLWYVLRSKPFMDDGVASMRGAAGQQRVPSEFVENFSIPLYEQETQRAIADYLDERITKIDTLIDKKSELLDLLEDKKESITTEYTTRGVDSQNTLKSVEQEWVGKVPSHWEETRIGSLIEEVKNPVDVDESEEYQEIGIRSYGKGIFHKEPVEGEDIGDKRVFWVENNALIFNIVFAWEGAVAVTSEDEVGMIASHRFPMYVPKQDVCLEYLKYFFTHGYGQGILDWNSPGAAGRNRTLNRSAMLNERFWFPSFEEQQRIVESISRKVNLIDELSGNIEKSIELLKEKRETLITAAVAGQIDVTEEQGEEQESFA